MFIDNVDQTKYR